MSISNEMVASESRLEEVRQIVGKEFERLNSLGALEQYKKTKAIDVSSTEDERENGDTWFFDFYDPKYWTENEDSWQCELTAERLAKIYAKMTEEAKVEPPVELKAENFHGKPADVKVYFRFRPLVGREIERNDAEIKRDIKQEQCSATIKIETEKKGKVRQRIRLRRKKKEEAPARKTQTWTGAGFTKGFEGGDNNEAVFSNSIQTQLEVMMKGGTLSCFSYGHTESGKTHTQLGYGSEKGMFYLTAAALCNHIDQMNKETDSCAKIEVRFFELHNKKVYDLLNNRAEGFIREGDNHEVLIRGKTERLENGRFQVRPLHSVTCSTPDEVEEAVKHGIALRCVGSSTLHEKSSRSHAFIELEVVNEKINESRAAVLAQESELTYFGQISTELKVDVGALLFSQECYKRREDGSYLCTVPKKVPLFEMLAYLEKSEILKSYYEDLFTQEKENCEKIFGEQKSVNALFGGRALFVDLAGSEHGNDKSAKKQTRAEQREGKEINQSLFALKEVIRKQMRGEKRIPFRQSRLTMVMREYLTSEICTTMMIANVSPSKQHSNKTLDTLRYALTVAQTHSSEKKVKKTFKLGAKNFEASA